MDKVLKAFQDANLVANPQNLVKAASGEFNAKVLQDLGGYTGDYPGMTLPQGITMTYKVNNISMGKSDNLVVTIAKTGAQSKTFNILVDVTKVKLVNVDSEDKAQDKQNLNYDSKTKTLTIGDNVGEINFDLSKIWDIEHINWGNQPQNILAIGYQAFSRANLTSLDLSQLVNLAYIGDAAFATAPIKTLVLSNLTNLEQISYRAFIGAQLTNLDLSHLSNLTVIGEEAFKQSNLKTLTISGLNNLEEIGEAAFAQSTLTQLDLSSLVSLDLIGPEAFSASTLTDLDLSKLTNLAIIGDEAFGSSPLKRLNLAYLNKLDMLASLAFKSMAANSTLIMEKANYAKFIYDKNKGIDNQQAIFGPNWNTVTRIDPTPKL